MKRIRMIFVSFCMVFFIVFAVPLTTLAASMQNDWSNNSWVGWNYNVRGGIVYAVQSILFSSGRAMMVDGYYGSQTAETIRSYQSAHGLSSDGTVGSQTWGEMQTHRYYLGSSGVVYHYAVTYNTDYDVDFQMDYINGWCVYDPQNNWYIKCDGTHYTIRTIVPA